MRPRRSASAYSDRTTDSLPVDRGAGVPRREPLSVAVEIVGSDGVPAEPLAAKPGSEGPKVASVCASRLGTVAATEQRSDEVISDGRRGAERGSDADSVPVLVRSRVGATCRRTGIVLQGVGRANDERGGRGVWRAGSDEAPDGLAGRLDARGEAGVAIGHRVARARCDRGGRSGWR